MKNAEGVAITLPTGPVFISHSSRDATLAQDLVAALEAAGMACWISGRDVAPGTNYQEAIVAAIRAGRAMVLLLTAAANSSDEVKKELSLASAAGVTVYPVRLGGVQPNAALSYELATRQWIEGGDVPSIAARLAAAIGGNAPQPPTAEALAPLALPDKPSVAVLPFANIGGDSEQEYFADGMTEEIITALSRIRAFFVIARNSSFTYKGRAVDAKQVGRELGVRYVVEGSVRRGGSRVRIAAQLADAATGTQLWADRFDGSIEDVFELQDQVATSLIGAIEPRIRGAEIERALRKPPESLQAYDLLLRASPLFGSTDPQAQAQAEGLLREAIAMAPTYALALMQLARVLWTRVAAGQLQDTAQARADCLALTRRALAHCDDDADVLAMAGSWIALLANVQEGMALIEQALAFNPNSITVINMAAGHYAYAGQAAKALECVARAARINPFEGAIVRNYSAVIAHFVVGEYEQALPYATSAIHGLPSFLAVASLRYRTACLGLLGRIDEARASAAQLRAIMPDLTVARARSHLDVDMNGIIGRAATDALCEGLRIAGIPEA